MSSLASRKAFTARMEVQRMSEGWKAGSVTMLSSLLASGTLSFCRSGNSPSSALASSSATASAVICAGMCSSSAWSAALLTPARRPARVGCKHCLAKPSLLTVRVVSDSSDARVSVQQHPCDHLISFLIAYFNASCTPQPSLLSVNAPPADHTS